ncbi:UNVERIFIED_CONTAM: hypothetical protein H355_011852 [Colinus virginianus]|nr:hypothetical protein H355_011852 [Colinus virginianus]
MIMILPPVQIFANGLCKVDERRIFRFSRQDVIRTVEQAEQTEQALCAGFYCFQCPVCRDQDRFIRELLSLGIRIPVRRARWEDNNAYASLLERHGRCDASECHYPRGREQAERAG